MELQEKILDSLYRENTHEYFRKLDKNQILENIIPKIQDMKKVGECKYHVVNCFDHSLNALEEFENMLKDDLFFPSHLKERIWSYLSIEIEEGITILHILKLGVFLHDVGKPDAKTTDDTGRVHFKGHENIGAKIAFDLGENIGISSKSVDILYKYVKHHMSLLIFYKINDLTQEKLYNLFDILKEETIGVMLLGYADIVSTRKLLNPNEEVGTIKTYMEYILTNYEYRYKRR